MIISPACVGHTVNINYPLWLWRVCLQLSCEECKMKKAQFLQGKCRSRKAEKKTPTFFQITHWNVTVFHSKRVDKCPILRKIGRQEEWANKVIFPSHVKSAEMGLRHYVLSCMTQKLPKENKETDLLQSGSYNNDHTRLLRSLRVVLIIICHFNDYLLLKVFCNEH